MLMEKVLSHSKCVTLLRCFVVMCKKYKYVRFLILNYAGRRLSDKLRSLGNPTTYNQNVY